MAIKPDPKPIVKSGLLPPVEPPFLTPQRLKLFGIAGGGLLAVVVGAWFFITLGERKEAFANEELGKARMMAERQDLGAAASQFGQIAENYRGTQAAYDASLGLAQVRLILEQNEGAIETLTKFLDEKPPRGHAAPGYGLLGTALENSGRHQEAAEAYLKAADLANVPYLKVSSLLDAARATRNAGKKPEAVTILKDIITKYPDVAGHVEASLMLGELTGGTGS